MYADELKMAIRALKVSGALEKWAPWLELLAMEAHAREKSSKKRLLSFPFRKTPFKRRLQDKSSPLPFTQAPFFIPLTFWHIFVSLNREPFPPEKAKKETTSRRRRSVNYTGL